MASGNISMTSSASDFQGRIVYSSTLNESLGTSTLTLTYQVRRVGLEGSVGGNSSGYSLSTTITSSTNVTNKNVTYTTSGNLLVDNNGSWKTIHTTTHTVTHASNGTASVSITCRFNGTVNKVYFNAENKSITLDTIVKQAYLTSAPDFTNIDNPTIGYYNPMGSAVSGLAACISFDGSLADISYRSVSKTGTSYTFNLTDAEREVLIKGTSGGSRSLRFILRMTVNGTYYYSVLHRTFTLANVQPLMSATVIDTNSTTIGLTGDSNVMVQYFSDAQIAFNASGQNGATISSLKCVCGNKSRTSDGVISDVESGTFTFTATDSRGFTVTQTVNKTLIPYIKLTTKLQLLSMDTDGTGAVSISGNLFRGSFGKVTNNPVVSYRFRTQGGSWGSWTNVVYNITNDSYYSEVQLNGLDYQKTYEFEAKAVDSLMTVTTALTVKCMPVFDWGENDFQFNVPVHIEGNLVVTGTITSNGAAAPIDVDAPADYIVEQGTKTTGSGNSTANWVYRKWNSGVAECWCRKHIQTAVNTSWGNLYVSGSLPHTNITWGVTFTDIPVANITIAPDASGAFLIAGGSTSLTATNTGGYEIARGSALASAGNFYINYYAIGKWK